MGEIFPQSFRFRYFYISEIIFVPVGWLPFPMRSLVVQHHEKRLIVITLVEPFHRIVGYKIGVITFRALGFFIDT